MSASKVVKEIDAWVERIDGPIVACGVIALAASASLLFTGVIARYFFRTTFDIVEELSTNLVVWSVMILGGPVFRRGSHVGMEFLAEKLKGKVRAFHQSFISIIIFLMCAVLVWKGLEVVQLVFRSGRTTISGELSLWYMMIPVPMGALIFCYYLICEVVKCVCVLVDPTLYNSVFRARSELAKISDEFPDEVRSSME